MFPGSPSTPPPDPLLPEKLLDGERQLGEARTAGTSSNALTQRERDVLALIRRGLQKLIYRLEFDELPYVALFPEELGNGA